MIKKKLAATLKSKKTEWRTAIVRYDSLIELLPNKLHKTVLKI